ncbi:MFS siderochrome iron transporter 1 [Bacidia gigantensis]|uniref:MFS siderochrome iron transporter 1 n=1 Tax=Bacidia gigantensis TaxID=2732470 RepID=UPI001D05B968|nr:MFS siderochrome iron transporter 1 [Bacidia gigantensis]KAG8529839.1 MFS siderochrome iron transporter 1 [Bacidia gigantensis]
MNLLCDWPDWSLVKSQGLLVPEVVDYPYNGSGTEADPFVAEYIPHDPRDPMGFPMWKKWMITLLVAFATLTVAFVSSAYSGGFLQIIETFHVSEEVVTLGLSLYVLGFAIGPLFWAPLSEMFGRQSLFFITFGAFTAFNAGAAGAQNIETLIILRFFAGAFGSSPLTNAGGVIADMFPPAQRGLALPIFAAAPFMGPILGPIVGGFVGQSVGWRWIQGVMAIFSGTLWIINAITLPETYSPVILRSRAAALSKRTGNVYKSRIEISQGKVDLGRSFRIALSRPWILLLREPIVLLLAIYMAIVYGTLYMLFPAFPIIFQQERGWSQGIGGLAFLGVAVGMLAAVAYAIPDNGRYRKIEDVCVEKGERGAPPEARLPPALYGASIRRNCKYAKESDDFMDKIKGKKAPSEHENAGGEDGQRKGSATHDDSLIRLSSYESKRSVEVEKEVAEASKDAEVGIIPPAVDVPVTQKEKEIEKAGT